MPRKVFVAGEILTAADVNTNLMDQAVMVFADSTARTAAIPSPSEGMITYLEDTDAVEKYDGAAFVNVDTGKILQVVSTVKTDTFSTSSTSFTAVTGLSVSITPSSATSKVLVFLDASTGSDPGAVGVNGRLVRDSTAIAIGDAAGSRTRASTSPTSSAGANPTNAINFLDSPATTSSVTYSFEIRATTSNPVYVNRSSDDTDSNARARTVSTITVMEVAG